MRSTNLQSKTDGRRRWALALSRPEDARDPILDRPRWLGRGVSQALSAVPSVVISSFLPAVVLGLCLVLLTPLLGLGPVASAQPATPFDAEAERQAMVSVVEARVSERVRPNPTVLDAMRRVPRHLFVPRSLRAEAYLDTPLAIGHGQTISQPSVVAMMTSLLDLDRGDKVLEIGTGSGYHAAVLSRVAAHVYSMEILPGLARKAATLLNGLNYHNITIRNADGYHGWAEHAPYDAILLTAATPEEPQPLLDQLKVGGKMVLPLGKGSVQELLVLTKTAETVERAKVSLVRFVPMTGEVLHPQE